MLKVWGNELIYSSNKTLNKGLVYFLLALASYKGADFTHSFLAPYYEKIRNPLSGPLMIGNGSTYIEPNSTYFRIEGEKTIYNLYDTGNFIWGTWTQMLELWLEAK